MRKASHQAGAISLPGAFSTPDSKQLSDGVKPRAAVRGELGSQRHGSWGFESCPPLHLCCLLAAGNQFGHTQHQFLPGHVQVVLFVQMFPQIVKRIFWTNRSQVKKKSLCPRPEAPGCRTVSSTPICSPACHGGNSQVAHNHNALGIKTAGFLLPFRAHVNQKGHQETP